MQNKGKRHLFFSDTHLDKRTQSHSNGKAQDALQKRNWDLTTRIVGVPDVYKVHTGDLFNTKQVDNACLLFANKIVSSLSVILGGNHDLYSQADKVSSFELLSGITKDNSSTMYFTEFGNSDFFVKKVGAIQYWLLPHLANQELFEQALYKLVELRKSKSNYEGVNFHVVLLHCNYNNSLTEGVDSALNLSTSNADELLQVFDYVFMGHEHTPALKHDGKLVIVGNQQPLNFSDISDKYVWYLDEVSGSLSRTKIWSKEQKYLEIEVDPETVTDLISDTDKLRVLVEGKEFIKIVGTIPAEDAPHLQKLVSYIWDHNPFMVRSDVKFLRGEVEIQNQSIEDLHQVISYSLPPAEQKLFNKLAEKVSKQ